MLDPTIFQMTAVAIGLETWARHRVKVNQAYTPKAMMATAQRLTGRTFAARDYEGAAKALRIARQKLVEEIETQHIIERTK